ncbi:hypothetical protein PTTG_27570 [Puccinia triticina 1-1 BBBD Race 1]|uniref:Uncharacterized protein n=1 Tax=Puccinia triticina (isolate 1-1 / race 1 (BBBD)) TaxID=630390 RepID=A0A180GIL8_PUCT1|nr:hypothetical protein PTTG_27570 [Puccinia triticina 1-1 BBBD Race 1]
MSTSFPLQPPFPRTRSGSTVYFPLIDPPTIFSFGGSFDGALQGNLYSFSIDPAVSTPNLTAKLVATRDGHLFLWGGMKEEPGRAEQDTRIYSLSLSTSSWSRYTVSGPFPAATFGSTTTIFEVFFYVYAGTDMNGLAHDRLWQIDIDHCKLVSLSGLYMISKLRASSISMYISPVTSNSLWENVSYPRSPAARTGHLAIVYACSWIVFGGSNGENVFNDIWTFDFGKKEWTSVACSGSLPPPRQQHSALRLGEKMFVFGGVDGQTSKLCDMWALDLLSYAWYEVACKGGAEMMTIGQLTAAWDETIYLLGSNTTTAGLPLRHSLYHTLDCLKITSSSTPSRDFQLVFGDVCKTVVALPHELYPTNDLTVSAVGVHIIRATANSTRH